MIVKGRYNLGMNKALKYADYAAWIVAIAAMSGSLFFSQGMHLTPCILCWFQRICMYPLVFLIPIGILRKDSKLGLYVLPLSLIGLSIALYHVLLYYSIIPESLAPCSAGISCTTKLVEYFGFISIPLLSLMAFTLITIGMIVSLKIGRSNE